MLLFLTNDLIPKVHLAIVSHLQLSKPGFCSELDSLLMGNEVVDTKNNLYDLLNYFGYNFDMPKLEKELYQAIVEYYVECTKIIFNCTDLKKIKKFENTLLKMYKNSNWEVILFSAEDNHETTNPILIALKKSGLSHNSKMPLLKYYHIAKVVV